MRVICRASRAMRTSPFRRRYCTGVLSFAHSDIDVAAINAGEPASRAQVNMAILLLLDLASAGVPSAHRPPAFITTHTALLPISRRLVRSPRSRSFTTPTADISGGTSRWSSHNMRGKNGRFCPDGQVVHGTKGQGWPKPCDKTCVVLGGFRPGWGEPAPRSCCALGRVTALEELSRCSSLA